MEGKAKLAGKKVNRQKESSHTAEHTGKMRAREDKNSVPPWGKRAKSSQQGKNTRRKT